MKRRIGTLMLLVVGALAVPVLAVADPIAILSYRSEPGDYIGGGRTDRFVFQGPADLVRASIWGPFPNTTPPAAVSFFMLRRTPDFQFAILDFATYQLGIPLQRGTYIDAQRAPFAEPGHPGLAVALTGRGSNTLTGSFTISDVRFVRDSFGELQVDRFRAEFEQHSEGATPALFGTFSFDASPVPEPGTLLFFGTGAIGLLARCRRRLAI